MPELPEVETVRRAMEAHLPGRRIIAVGTSGRRLREPVPCQRLRALCGLSFSGARRRAKYLLLDLTDGSTLLIHLGMSGNLLLRPGGQRHDHVIWRLDEGPDLVLADPRRFGLVQVLDASQLAACPYLRHLGVEPLEDAFDMAYLRHQCRGRSRAIKSLIMDSRVVAGIGNIYANEALFHARIRPTTPAGKLTIPRLRRLVVAIKSVLQAAVHAGGTTISDYQGAGAGGYFQQQLAVYGRAGAPCPVCARVLESIVLAGRSTYFCRRCQR